MNFPLTPITEYKRYEKKIPTDLPTHFSKRIILISDTHISSNQSSAFNNMMFRKGIEEISQIRDVDYIIHLGDLTHDGTYLDYQVAKDLIRKFTDENFHIIPGNHDARNVGYLLFEELFKSRTFEIQEPNLYVLGVDSSIPDQDAGHIGEKLINISKNAFYNNQNKLKIFCFHHQLIPIPYTGRERSAIFDGGDVLDMALKTNVDIILNGHRHISNTYTCTDGDSDLVIFNCGTLSSNKTRYRELFSYTIMDINDRTVKFTTKQLLDGSYSERWKYINYKFETPKPRVEQPFLKIIHTGNTHFGKISYNKQILESALQQIQEVQPDLLIHTGSVTANNQDEDYAIAKNCFQNLHLPKIILPGFKDLTKYGWDRYEKWFGNLDPHYEDSKSRIIGINTVDAHISSGRVGRKHMRETCENFMNTNDSKINIVAFNHRLIPPPLLKFDAILTDAGSVLKNFTDVKNNINLICMGKNNSAFSLQCEESILSYCGSISSNNTVKVDNHSFNEIQFYPDGAVFVYKHLVEKNESELIGAYWQKRNLQ
ncbi:3',5'-cyclic adenosine monophosphate phosphodiesterase CpdA [Candidatus Lokiarchaeum ossiferum]|uniref:3',5'-cyclic adenosine monophosphate phosphodiesterase CpdA n=1 Tax=Candidatus Lokiarchaeum ossiferum TaxID=2951803 RepID=A0ABY6HQI3_9ARCH|nr:3',5'-cyclic adenosine monophosphate phosphodiesterase CpdA [Candidatus Lokiarchaeum sp. B-35]